MFHSVDFVTIARRIMHIIGTTNNHVAYIVPCYTTCTEIHVYSHHSWKPTLFICRPIYTRKYGLTAIYVIAICVSCVAYMHIGPKDLKTNRCNMDNVPSETPDPVSRCIRQCPKLESNPRLRITSSCPEWLNEKLSNRPTPCVILLKILFRFKARFTLYQKIGLMSEPIFVRITWKSA